MDENFQRQVIVILEEMLELMGDITEEVNEWTRWNLRGRFAEIEKLIGRLK